MQTTAVMNNSDQLAVCRETLGTEHARKMQRPTTPQQKNKN